MQTREAWQAADCETSQRSMLWPPDVIGAATGGSATHLTGLPHTLAALCAGMLLLGTTNTSIQRGYVLTAPGWQTQHFLSTNLKKNKKQQQQRNTGTRDCRGWRKLRKSLSDAFVWRRQPHVFGKKVGGCLKLNGSRTTVKCSPAWRKRHATLRSKLGG